MRRAVFCVALVSWLSVAEWTILERLYADPASSAFVAESVRGVLAGTPVSKSWQHRFAGPILALALGGPDRVLALTLLAANLLLLWILRRRPARALVAVACLGLAHLLLAYKLEYTWDGVDQIVFVAFGAWAARGGGLVPLAPLLLLGTFNHETILYLPFFYLLSRDRKERLAAIGFAAAIGAVVLATRGAFYKGQPDLPGQVFEPAAPLVGNHLHVIHNLRQLFVEDWLHGRAHISAAILAVTAGLSWMIARAKERRAAAWSLVILATVVCFGYVNETRHYLVLAAFWVAYVSANHGSDGVGVVADAGRRELPRGDDVERRVDPDLIEPREPE